MTQAERVLKASRSFRGTCQADFLEPYVCDGGSPITRVAARIQDLEEQGHVFEILHDRNGTRVYRLAGVEGGRSPSVEVPAPRAPSPAAVALNVEQPSLFTIEPRTRSPYDLDAA